jgi:hypothetical protein
MAKETKKEEVQKTSVEIENPKKLRGIDNLLKDSWGIFAGGWKKYLLYYLLTMAILIAAGILSILVLIIAMTLLKGLIGLVIGIIFIIIILVLFGTPLGLAMNKLVFSFGEQKEESIKDVLKYGIKYFPSYLFISIITGLLIAVGLIFLIIPAIIIGVMLSLVAPVFVLENNHKLEALRRSRELVRGYFWPVFGRLLLIVVISGAISSVQRITPNVLVINIAQGAFSLVANFILTFFGIAYTYLIYKDLSAGSNQKTTKE